MNTTQLRGSQTSWIPQEEHWPEDDLPALPPLPLRPSPEEHRAGDGANEPEHGTDERNPSEACPPIMEGTLVAADKEENPPDALFRPGDGAFPAPRRRGVVPALLGAWTALTLLLVLALVADRAPGLLSPLTGWLPRGWQPSATIALLPQATTLSTTLQLPTTPGASNLGTSHVQVRMLTLETPSATRTVPTTGHGQSPAQQARGTLTFYNAATSPQTVVAGTLLTTPDGIQVTTDAPVLVPAGHPPIFGVASVAAHALLTGPQGNLAAGVLASLCCAPGISVNNVRAWTGGQDARTYPVVTPEDLRLGAVPLVTRLTAEAHSALMQQRQPSEQWLVPLSCHASVTADQPAGSAATQVTLTVALTCQGTLYDQQAVQQIATSRLGEQAQRGTGTEGTLAGSVSTTVQGQRDPHTGALVLVISAQGLWMTAVSTTRLVALAHELAGTTVAEAQALVLAQPGIRAVSITLTGGRDTLPTDPQQIKIVMTVGVVLAGME